MPALTNNALILALQPAVLRPLNAGFQTIDLSVFVLRVNRVILKLNVKKWNVVKTQTVKVIRNVHLDLVSIPALFLTLVELMHSVRHLDTEKTVPAPLDTSATLILNATRTRTTAWTIHVEIMQSVRVLWEDMTADVRLVAQEIHSLDVSVVVLSLILAQGIDVG